MNKTLNRISQTLAALLIVVAWWKVNEQVALWGFFNGYSKMYLFLAQSAGLLFLIPCVLVFSKYLGKIKLGHAFKKSSLPPVLAIAGIYVVEYAFSRATNQGNELSLIGLLNSSLQNLPLTFITILIIAPISEELVFRGFLLNSVSKGKPLFFWCAATAIAVLFAFFHSSQYFYNSTIVEIFAVAMVFSWARLKSGGILLPILLHMLASTLGLVTFYLL